MLAALPELVVVTDYTDFCYTAKLLHDHFDKLWGDTDDDSFSWTEMEPPFRSWVWVWIHPKTHAVVTELRFALVDIEVSRGAPCVT